MRVLMRYEGHPHKPFVLALMSSPEFYRERAARFTALAAAANNEPMARLYAAMAADYLAKADGQQASLDSVPSIMIVPAALADRRK